MLGHIGLIRRTLVAALLAGLALANAIAQSPLPNGAGLRPGVLPGAWLPGGPKCVERPEFQIHEYNEDLYILRQSGCSNFEKPFLYLLFGKEKALLLYTGAGKNNVARFMFSIRPPISATLNAWSILRAANSSLKSWGRISRTRARHTSTT